MYGIFHWISNRMSFGAVSSFFFFFKEKTSETRHEYNPKDPFKKENTKSENPIRGKNWNMRKSCVVFHNNRMENIKIFILKICLRNSLSHKSSPPTSFQFPISSISNFLICFPISYLLLSFLFFSFHDYLSIGITEFNIFINRLKDDYILYEHFHFPQFFFFHSSWENQDRT